MPTLTDEQCMRFLQLPLPFNEMVREIYKAGMVGGFAYMESIAGRMIKEMYGGEVGGESGKA
jgi:hypothetical protein